MAITAFGKQFSARHGEVPRLAERILTATFLRLRLKESFDRFNSKFTRRRKEMVNFRRAVTLLAVLVLFTGLAFAQSESCSAQGTVSTPLRAEGFTEQTGDIIITCTGGQPIAQGANIPLVNIQVFYTTTVTSRLLSSTATNAGQYLSEALLLIDEPNTAPAGIGNVGVLSTNVQYGQTLPLNPCLQPTTGCLELAGPTVNGFTTAYPTGSAVGTQGYNVYQGLTSGNSVTFFGVPALPPTTVGSRIYRITNVRVNATQGGIAAGTQPINGFISVSGAGSFPISNAQPVVGFIQPGLSAKVTGAKTFQQCNSVTTATSTGTNLAFTELFGTAFKTRVVAQKTDAGNGQNGTMASIGLAPAQPNQSTPGAIYNSESNFVYNGFSTGGTAIAGLADFGTRLKAHFAGVPSGVRVFVSSANKAAPTNPGGSGDNASNPGYAVIVSGGETASDGTGFVPTSYAAGDTTEVTIASGEGNAVWEVVNTNPNTTETFNFGVFISYTAATATNTPATGSATVTLTYAPTATSAAASATLPIPRFNNGNSPFTGTFFTINKCRTILLYPYITNQGGFDTGLTVANTSQDPVYSTGEQHGTCTFTWYGGTTALPTTNPNPVTTPSIAGGTVYAFTLSDPVAGAPTFQGYAFAICDFQFAHGFAFISDLGARNLAMGYLALIIPDKGSRDPSPFGNGAGTGEQEAH
jgi:hypothetical protein